MKMLRPNLLFACLLVVVTLSKSVFAWTSLPRILSLTERNLRHFALVPIHLSFPSSANEEIEFERKNNSTQLMALKKSSSGLEIMVAVQTSGLDKTILAVRDGLAASMASIVSVFLLMWLRTSMSYQHVKGVTMSEAIRELYADGGIGRFYRGLLPALIMMPLSRFGDIFTNRLAREFQPEWLPAAVATIFASSLAAGWRILISPADTIKTMMQVHGANGLSHLRAKVARSGVSALFEGALGASVATWMGHYPWCVKRILLVSLIVSIISSHTRFVRYM